MSKSAEFKNAVYTLQKHVSAKAKKGEITVNDINLYNDFLTKASGFYNEVEKQFNAFKGTDNYDLIVELNDQIEKLKTILQLFNISRDKVDDLVQYPRMFLEKQLEDKAHEARDVKINETGMKLEFNRRLTVRLLYCEWLFIEHAATKDMMVIEQYETAGPCTRDKMRDQNPELEKWFNSIDVFQVRHADSYVMQYNNHIYNSLIKANINTWGLKLKQ